MPQPGDRFGFLAKSALVLGARMRPGENHLQRDQPPQAEMPCLVDDPHSPRPISANISYPATLGKRRPRSFGLSPFVEPPSRSVSERLPWLGGFCFNWARKVAWDAWDARLSAREGPDV